MHQKGFLQLRTIQHPSSWPRRQEKERQLLTTSASPSRGKAPRLGHARDFSLPGGHGPCAVGWCRQAGRAKDGWQRLSAVPSGSCFAETVRLSPGSWKEELAPDRCGRLPTAAVHLSGGGPGRPGVDAAAEGERNRLKHSNRLTALVTGWPLCYGCLAYKSSLVPLFPSPRQ